MTMQLMREYYLRKWLLVLITPPRTEHLYMLSRSGSWSRVAYSIGYGVQCPFTILLVDALWSKSQGDLHSHLTKHHMRLCFEQHLSGDETAKFTINVFTDHLWRPMGNASKIDRGHLCAVPCMFCHIRHDTTMSDTRFH
jgi:hypothetical protein